MGKKQRRRPPWPFAPVRETDAGASPAAFLLFFLYPAHLARLVRRRSHGDGVVDKLVTGDGGTAVVPLAGARVRPEPRAAPSSGTAVVPFWAEHARATSGTAGVSSSLPHAGKGSCGCSLPARWRDLSRTTAVVASR